MLKNWVPAQIPGKEALKRRLGCRIEEIEKALNENK